MKSKRADVESRMQRCLDRLGIPLKVLWSPKESDKHGVIRESRLLIYDQEEAETWLTFEHEVYEFKFREVTIIYRSLFNCLVGGYEKLAYEKKERVLEFLPKITKIISKARAQTKSSL